MTVDAALPKDHPAMVAWEAYRQTPDYENTLRWTAAPEHAPGSLFAAFWQGYNAAFSAPDADGLRAAVIRAIATVQVPGGLRHDEYCGQEGLEMVADAALAAGIAHIGRGFNWREFVVRWAVDRWNAEVKNRPIPNIHRRALDTSWRQVMRHFGGDPDLLVGPSHDDLVEQARKGGAS